MTSLKPNVLILLVRPALTLIILLLVPVFLYLFSQKEALIDGVYREMALSMHNQAASAIDDKRRQMASLAFALSQNRALARAVTVNDKEAIASVLEPVKSYLLQKQIDPDVWIQAVDPRGFSRYRTWTDKTDDDLLPVREELRKLVEHPREHHGVSVGIFRMTFKNTAPLTGEAGKPAGFVEVISGFSSIIGQLASAGIETGVVIDKKYRNQLTRPISNRFIGDYNLVRSTPALTALLERASSPEALLHRKGFWLEEGSLFTVHPLPDPEGEPMGYLLLGRSQQGIAGSTAKKLAPVDAALAGTGLLLAALVLLFLLYSAALKKERNALNQANALLSQEVKRESEKRIHRERELFNQSKVAYMGEMMMEVSHHWRQPLNTVSILVQDIQDAWEYGELNQEYLDKTVGSIVGQLKRMSDTLDQFRDIRKSFSQPREFTPYTFLETLAAELDQTYGKEGVRIRFQPAAGLETLSFCSHPDEIDQILRSLVENGALACMERGGGEVALALDKRPGGLTITVSDTGGGVPAVVMERIFEPYFTTRQEGGARGIGLYLARTMAEKLLGGSLTAANKEQGAVLTLGLTPVEERPAPPCEPLPPESGKSPENG